MDKEYDSDQPAARLTPQHLMSRILTCDDERDWYGLYCDREGEIDVPAELRDIELRSVRAVKVWKHFILPRSHLLTILKQICPMTKHPQTRLPDPAILEKQLCIAARGQDVKTL